MRGMVLLVVIHYKENRSSVTGAMLGLCHYQRIHESFQELACRYLVRILAHDHGMQDTMLLGNGQVQANSTPTRRSIGPCGDRLCSSD